MLHEDVDIEPRTTSVGSAFVRLLLFLIAPVDSPQHKVLLALAVQSPSFAIPGVRVRQESRANRRAKPRNDEAPLAAPPPRARAGGAGHRAAAAAAAAAGDAREELFVVGPVVGSGVVSPAGVEAGVASGSGAAARAGAMVAMAKVKL